MPVQRNSFTHLRVILVFTDRNILAQPNFNIRCSMFDVWCSMFNVRCSMFDIQCSVFDTQCSIFNGQCSMFNVQRWIFNIQIDIRSLMFNVRCSTFDVQYSTFKSIFNGPCSIFNVQWSMGLTAGSGCRTTCRWPRSGRCPAAWRPASSSPKSCSPNLGNQPTTALSLVRMYRMS